MRIVKLSNLSEKERKKVLEEQEQRYQQNKAESQKLQKKANEDFVRKNGTGVTQTSHTFTHRDVLNAMESKEQRKNYRKANGLTLWDTIKTITGNVGRIGKNIGLGMDNGLKSSFQLIGRNLSNQLADRADMINKLSEREYNAILKEHPEKKEEIENRIKNPVISGDKIRFDAQKASEKIQSQKDINTKKIQENVSKTEGSVGKYLAGEIAPGIGQMLPGMVGGPTGMMYFMTSAGGNYYDDAKARGMDEKQATVYSGVMGMIEGSLESVGAKLTTNVGKQLLKKNIKGALVNYGLDVGENFLEESIVEPIQEMVASSTAGKDKADWGNMKERMLKSGINGAVTSMITGGASGLIGQTVGSVRTAKANQNMNYWLNQAQNIVNQNQQNADNKVVNQENKIAQNPISQTENQIKQQTIDKLSIVRQFYDENTYNQMKEFIETAPNEKALNQINEDMKTETKNKLETIYKSERFAESKERKQTYAKYQRENNTKGIQYDNNIANHALDAISANRNGRRTVGQWKQVAEQIGLEVSNLSKKEIDNIAYGSWFDLQPNKNITRYDNRTKEQKGFEKFTSDDWVNAIYASAKGQKLQQLDTALATEQYSLSEAEVQNRFEYKQSDNAKIDTFRQDASKYWDNSEKTAKLVNTIEKVINDKGYNIRLNDTIGDNVNGKIVTNQQTGEIEITINPNSSRAGEFILGHELTHAIQTQEMVDLVNQRMQKDGEFKKAVEDLKKLYNANEVNAEVLADISGQLFGNQEFINNLSVEKPNVFKRIYDKIISLANKITGNSNEALFIKDLRSKWEQAYRENNNTINEEQYSIETENHQEKLENNVKKVYNIINKSITNSERNQVSSEVLTWRNNQEDGVGYIDLSAKGYKSYIYNKQGNNVETLLKVNGNEDFKNYIRKGIEDGTFTKTEGLIKPIDAIKNEYRRYSNNNDLLSRRTDNSNDKLSVGFNGEQGTDNSTKNIKQSSRNESIKNSEKSSFSMPKEIQDIVFNEEFYDNFKYEDKSTINETIEDLQRQQELLTNESDSDWDKNFDINQKIKALQNGYDNVYDYLIGREKQSIFQDYKYNPEKYEKKMQEHKKNIEKQNKLQKEIEEATPFKREQYEIIQKTNPMFDDVHTGIRSPADIKTFKECIENAENDSVFEWGDYSLEDAQKDLKRNKVRIYSSYAIKNGTFVSTSYQQALDYAGGDRTKVHSREVNPNKVAWINGDEGQYASTSAKYSKQNNKWQNYLESNYKSEGTTTDLRDIRLPMKEKQEVKLPMKQENTKGEGVNWAEIERPEDDKKFRKHYKSIIESSNTTAEAKSIAKDLMGTDTYVPETNKGELIQADERIASSSPETELQSLISKSINNEKISPVDIATGERLIQYFSKTGSKEQLQEAIQATALAGTRAGQTVQALAILNHQTPQGQVTWLQRSVDKMNKELAKKKGGIITTDADGNLQIVNKQGKDITNKVNLFNLTPEMMNKIMQSENQEKMLKNINEVYEELGQQVPKSMLEKIDSWRYFSMLANIRTHGRNMIGNFAMGKMQRVKDKIAGGIEDIVSKFNPEMERTKTLKLANKKTREFAKQDFKNIDVQARLELNESKFNPQSRLQNSRRTFKSNLLENTLGRLFNLNDKLLEAEDGIGLKAGYQKALSDYITANKIDVNNITDKQLNKARNYAIQQAKEATFHQANAIASAIAQFENKNLATKLFTGAVLPFKKTPMNVAKAGMEYSPLQIAKSATIDVANLRKGKISINQYIDNLSKGMTGTGIALAGYALAKAGILKASGGDDKDKEKYDEEQGKQSYSIELGGKNYSLDWLAPTGIPLFIGAETHKLFNQENTEKSTEKTSEEDKLNRAIKGATNLLNAGATAINPMSEMSMISGLTSALSSYNTSDNLGSLGNIMTNAGKSYINQFVPTALGQVAKTGDEYERSTKSTATGTIGKAVDQTINQIKNKIPGLRQTLPIKTDIWGKDVKQEVNLPLRAFNNFINPATVKGVSTDDVDKELNKLYEVNSNRSILPDTLQKKLTINNQDYRLTNKEYAEQTKNYGKTSYELIGNLIKTSDYKNLTQEQKEEAISNIYSYVKEQNKVSYARKVGEEIEQSTLYKTMEAIKNGGGNQSEYLNYLSRTKGLDKASEKNKVLAKSNYSNTTKEIIYTNTTGKDDKLYNDLLKNTNIDIDEYLNYKNKVSKKAFKSDKDKNGKTITGSAKKKTIDYLNKNISGVGNRLLIAGKSYALQNNERQALVKYINKITDTKEEKLDIYKQLDKNFTVSNGKVYMKKSRTSR